MNSATMNPYVCNACANELRRKVFWRGNARVLIGINFDSEERNFDVWTAENFVTKERTER